MMFLCYLCSFEHFLAVIEESCPTFFVLSWRNFQEFYLQRRMTVEKFVKYSAEGKYSEERSQMYSREYIQGSFH